MRKVLLPLLASLAIATPAMANEARVEARGGVIWWNGASQDVWGAAAGYDFDLGKSAFAGVEVGGDKIGTSGTKVAWDATARAGMKLTEQTKAYVAGGYTTEPCDSCGESWHLGAGMQQGFGNKFYGKVEYRHNFVSNNVDSDALVVGAGLRF